MGRAKFPRQGVSERQRRSHAGRVDHGPPLPLAILHLLVVVGAVVAALVYLVLRRIREQRRSDQGPESGAPSDATAPSRDR